MDGHFLLKHVAFGHRKHPAAGKLEIIFTDQNYLLSVRLISVQIYCISHQDQHGMPDNKSCESKNIVTEFSPRVACLSFSVH